MSFCLAGGVQSAFQQLKEYEVQLKEIVRKRFDAAVELKNPEEITRLEHVSSIVFSSHNNISILVFYYAAHFVGGVFLSIQSL